MQSRSKVAHAQNPTQKAILSAALELVEQDGTGSLSIRAVAKRLDLAPAGLNRYFPDRKSLEATVAAEGTRRLCAALQRTTKGSVDAEAVRGACRAYLRFARRHPALYAMTMRKYPDVPALLAAREDLRNLFRMLFAPLGDPQSSRTAGLAVWASLHGMVAQERDGLLDDAEVSADSLSAVWTLVAALLQSPAG